MVTSDIKEILGFDIHKVWETVTAVDKYSLWRSDLSRTEIIDDSRFIEYTKEGYGTTFSVTVIEPYKRWEFDMENSNMKGHWVGVFTSLVCLSIRNCIKRAPKSTVPSQHRFGFEKPCFCSL